MKIMINCSLFKRMRRNVVDGAGSANLISWNVNGCRRKFRR